MLNYPVSRVNVAATDLAVHIAQSRGGGGGEGGEGTIEIRKKNQIRLKLAVNFQ